MMQLSKEVRRCIQSALTSYTENMELRNRELLYMHKYIQSHTHYTVSHTKRNEKPVHEAYVSFTAASESQQCTRHQYMEDFMEDFMEEVGLLDTLWRNCRRRSMNRDSGLSRTTSLPPSIHPLRYNILHCHQLLFELFSGKQIEKNQPCTATWNKTHTL